MGREKVRRGREQERRGEERGGKEEKGEEEEREGMRKQRDDKRRTECLVLALKGALDDMCLFPCIPEWSWLCEGIDAMISVRWWIDPGDSGSLMLTCFSPVLLMLLPVST